MKFSVEDLRIASQKTRFTILLMMSAKCGMISPTELGMLVNRTLSTLRQHLLILEKQQFIVQRRPERRKSYKSPKKFWMFTKKAIEFMDLIKDAHFISEKTGNA